MTGGLRRTAVALVVTTVMAASFVPMTAATAHGTDDWVHIYNPITDGDADHNDVNGWWPHSYGTSPAGHHIVFTNWGIPNDYSMDVFARATGRVIVTPFGASTNTGHRVDSVVVHIGATCASGSIADGGYLVTVEARDSVTGVVLGRADIGHVDRPQVWVGQVLGGWTPIGFTSRFRYSSCYQVSTDWGVHVHLEVQNRHAYACYIPMSYQAPLTDLTRIGIVGAHYGAQRAPC